MKKLYKCTLFCSDWMTAIVVIGRGKIVIFHTKYPKNVRASLRSTHFFLVRPLT